MANKICLLPKVQDLSFGEYSMAGHKTSHGVLAISVYCRSNSRTLKNVHDITFSKQYDIDTIV